MRTCPSPGSGTSSSTSFNGPPASVTCTAFILDMDFTSLVVVMVGILEERTGCFAIPPALIEHPECSAARHARRCRLLTIVEKQTESNLLNRADVLSRAGASR